MLVLKCNHKVVSISYQHCPSIHLGFNLFLKPDIQGVVQVYVRQYLADYVTLWRATGWFYLLPFWGHYSRF